jgi:hypothetical protein
MQAVFLTAETCFMDIKKSRTRVIVTSQKVDFPHFLKVLIEQCGNGK